MTNADTASNTNQDVKPDVKPDGEASIQLKVKSQDGNNETAFKVKVSTDLKKLMDAYCKRQVSATAMLACVAPRPVGAQLPLIGCAQRLGASAARATQGMTRDAVRFIFDGERISDGDTPKSLQMEDDDVIDAVLQQVGGTR